MNGLLIVFLLGTFATTHGNLFKLPTTTAPKGCVYNGLHYATGESFQPSPCEHCFCDPSGRAVCAIADCFITPCVDAVTVPGQCCPTCPNGENCRAPDGTLVSKGQKVTLSNGAVCQCASGFSWGQPQATCTMSVQAPTVAPS